MPAQSMSDTGTSLIQIPLPQTELHVCRFPNGPLLFRASELGYRALVQNSEILQKSLKAARIETQGMDFLVSAHVSPPTTTRLDD